MGDRIGEVYFLNVENLKNLTDPDEVPGRNDPAADSFDFVAKFVYGSQ